MSETYGYVRVSTKDQCEERQLIAMEEFGVPEANIFMDGQTMTLLFQRSGETWAYDRYRVTYAAKIRGVAGDRIDYSNAAVIPEIGGTPQTVEESVIIQNALVGVEQASVEIYKYDGDDTRRPLSGARFVLAPLKDDLQGEIIRNLQRDGLVSQEEFDRILNGLSQEESNWDTGHSFIGETDEDGSLTFTASDGNAIYANRIYLLKELESPEGYLLSEDGYCAFFLIYQSISDEGGAVKTYLAPYVPNSGLVVQHQVPNYKANFNVYKVSAYDAEAYLTGAEFTLYSDENCQQAVGHGVLTSDAEGRPCYYFGGLLVNRTYYLKETKAPDGFILEDRTYTVRIGEDGAVTFLLDGEAVESGHNNLFVENIPSLVLPETGGAGTTLYTAGGAALLALAGLMYKILRRRGEEAP